MTKLALLRTANIKCLYCVVIPEHEKGHQQETVLLFFAIDAFNLIKIISGALSFDVEGMNLRLWYSNTFNT